MKEDTKKLLYNSIIFAVGCAILVILLIPVVTGAQTMEDLTTYTEQDSTNKISETTTRVTAANVVMDVDTYLYKDFGIGYFDAIDFDFTGYDDGGSTSGHYAGFGLTNSLNDVSGFSGTDVSILLNQYEGGFRVQLWVGVIVASDVYAATANTPYYFTLFREAGNDNISLFIFSDSARTSLLDTLSVAGLGTTKYRYIMPFVDFNSGDGGRIFSGYIENVDLKQAPAPPTPAPSTWLDNPFFAFWYSVGDYVSFIMAYVIGIVIIISLLKYLTQKD